MELEQISDVDRATALLHPLRVRILEAAREPASAARIASRLGLARQNISYHVRQLAKARLLKRAGRRRRGNMYEQRYVATSRHYVLSQDVLGPLKADPREVEDALSAAYLLALSTQVATEVAHARDNAAAQGVHLSTLSINTTIGFRSKKQRAEFARALRDAVTDVVGRFSCADAEGAPSGPYRLMMGCYPIPKHDEERHDDDRGPDNDED